MDSEDKYKAKLRTVYKAEVNISTISETSLPQSPEESEVVNTRIGQKSIPNFKSKS